MASQQKERIEFDGLDDVIKMLRKVGAPSVEIREAGLKASRVVAEYSKQEAPVSSTKYKAGGRLKASVKAGATQRGGYIKVGTPKSVPYAGPILWGWFYDKNYFIQKNIKPNKFVFRAVGKHRPEVVELYRKEIQKLIDKYSNKVR